MNKKTKNIGVILAGGKGLRAGFSKPKQMMKLAGKPIVEHAIKAFEENKKIDEIFVVTNADCVDGIEQIVLSSRMTKVKAIINGGNERYESSLSAIEATKHYCRDFNVNLIFHDAVRPLLSQRIINDVVEALTRYKAVDVVVKTTDTIVAADPLTNTIANIPDRSVLRNGQTPQAFSHEVIEKAYNLALKDPAFVTTDDCGVVLKYLPDEKIYLVDGDNSNMKLTYEEDLHILDKLCQLSSTLVESEGNINFTLADLKNKVLVVIGGTSGIGEEICNIAKAYQARVIPLGKRTGFDICDLNEVKLTLEKINDEYGAIDYIVNSAGVLTRQPLIDMKDEDIIGSIQTNYIGAVNVAIASFPFLRKSRGQLLNFTSSSYTYGRALYSLYSSSKAAIVNITQALADEWHTQGIRVNCINPERTQTPMRTKAFGIEPEGTLLSAKEVAEKSLLVLLSEYTGQIFDVRKIK